MENAEEFNRPKLLELVGQDKQQKEWLEAYANGCLASSWIFSGAKFSGKIDFVNMATAHLLQNGAPKTAEDEEGAGLFGEELAIIPKEKFEINEDNEQIQRFINNSSSDVTILRVKEGKKEIDVSQVRDACANFALTSGESGVRILIIDSADEMNKNAQNALLKTLEEPPRNCFIFLISHAVGKLLPTIRSRCRVMRFQPKSQDEITDYNISKEEALVRHELKNIIDDFMSKLEEGENNLMSPINLKPYCKDNQFLILLSAMQEWISRQETPSIKLAKLFSEINKLKLQYNSLNMEAYSALCYLVKSHHEE